MALARGARYKRLGDFEAAAESHQHGVMDLTDLPVLVAGRYAPTLTDVAGYDSLTTASAHYMRVGDQVTVHFRFTGSTVAGEGEYAVFRMSLPIASVLASVEDLAGSIVVTHADLDWIGEIEADTTNDEAQVRWWKDDVAVADAVLVGTFQYQVLS